MDTALRAWAQSYKAFAIGGGGRNAFIAPLQEMNGDWTSYGGNPTNFKQAYAHIQQIFAQEGVPSGSVQWVFAPNNVSGDGMAPFEDYYPGNNTVDIVGFSGYNFGYHSAVGWKDWQAPEEVFSPYLARMRVMAPGKPLFIAQTATTAYTSSGYNQEAKNQWLRDALAYLSMYPDFRVLVYYNMVTPGEGIDWPFYVPGNTSQQYVGYQDGIVHPHYCYLSPKDVLNSSIVTR